MPERYTGTPSRSTACAIAPASRASTSAWLPITRSGCARTGERLGRALDAHSRPRAAAPRSFRPAHRVAALPAKSFAAWRFRYQRSSRSPTTCPLPAASAYQPRMSFSS